jgi:hypothetical protein
MKIYVVDTMIARLQQEIYKSNKSMRQIFDNLDFI